MSHQEFPCSQCGAKLTFAPGTTTLTCAYCGHENPIPQSEADIREQDFHAALAAAESAAETVVEQTLQCPACAATVTLDPHVTSDECPFCGTHIVLTGGSTKVIRPESLLPFKVTREEAREGFRRWVASRWFAPNDFKKRARRQEGLSGIYLPYWTYDCQTTTFYRGERGEHYWDTETVTTRGPDGKMKTETRQVRKTRWYPAHGTVWVSFDDLLVLASNSLPRKYVEKLEPWDLDDLQPYTDEYLSGFRAEAYQVGIEQGFESAKTMMDAPIRSAVRRDIGGDEQRIHSIHVQYDNITFKHLLLPVWLSSYRYRKNLYRFMINARTGEVQGERPWSWVKIALVVLVVLLVIGLIVFFAMRGGF